VWNISGMFSICSNNRTCNLVNIFWLIKVFYYGITSAGLFSLKILSELEADHVKDTIGMKLRSSKEQTNTKNLMYPKCTLLSDRSKI
jgi:hypothetical protein